MSSLIKRRDTDVTKLMMSDLKVETKDDCMQLFHVIFNGPENSPYHGGMWRIRVELPNDYPFRPPILTFVNTIYHPNVDEISGRICLDAIKQTWSPMFDLANVFEMFLPQLLMYPNPSDPLNSEAAALMNEDPKAYEQRVKEYCEKCAKPEDLGVAPAPEEESSDKELSEDDHDSSTEAVACQDDP